MNTSVKFYKNKLLHKLIIYFVFYNHSNIMHIYVLILLSILKIQMMS
jgi:hypothetical protein